MIDPRDSTAPRPSSRRKIFREIRRRGWLVVLTAVLVAAVAWGVGRSLSHDYTAEAIAVVRAKGALASQPESSTKLAASYAALIPLDVEIEKAVVTRLGGDGSPEYNTTNDTNTSLLRITFKAPSSDKAIAGAEAVAAVISDPASVTSSIDPGTISVISEPESAASSDTKLELTAVGAVLGLVLGLVLATFWRGRDERIDEAYELRERLNCPCYLFGTTTGEGFGAVAFALGENGDGQAIALPAGPGDQTAAKSVSSVLNEILGDGIVRPVPPPGRDGNGEIVAAAHSTMILVVSPGARRILVDEAVDILTRLGSPPTLAVFVVDGGGKRRRNAGPDRRPDVSSQRTAH